MVTQTFSLLPKTEALALEQSRVLSIDKTVVSASTAGTGIMFSLSQACGRRRTAAAVIFPGP